MSIFRLGGPQIRDYREVANASPGLVSLGFAPERVAKLLAREARELAARPESRGHT